MQTSFLRKGNAYNPELLSETKSSLAGIWIQDPRTFWVEAVSLFHSPLYPDAHFGITTGVGNMMGPGQLNIEWTGIQQTLNQTCLGYQWFLNRYWTLGSTYRYTSCVEGNDGCVAVRGFGQGSSLDVAIRLGFGGEENENPVKEND